VRSAVNWFAVSRFPARLLSVAVVATTGALVWLAWLEFDDYRIEAATRDRPVRVTELRGTIGQLDEVLTMSARMAAATGDLAWERRYLEFEPRLDAAIKEAIALSPSAFARDGAAETDAANLELVGMEKRAFELVRAARLDEARAVLFSEDYERQKRTYAHGMSRVSEAIREDVADTLRARESRDLRRAWTQTVIALLVVAIWGFTLRVMHRWHASLQEANRLLAAEAGKLAELNQDLDRTVADRTRDLESSRSEALSSMELFRQMAETIEDVFWVLDAATDRFVYVSPAFERVFGRSRAPVSEISAVWEGARHPDERGPVAGGARAGHEARDETYRIVRPDGSVRWLRDRAFPIPDGDGAVVRVIGIAQDVTAAREADLALRDSEEQLRHAQKMEAVGRLAGGIAHDFNNLLTVIVGYGRIAASDDGLDSKFRGKLDKIVAAGDRATALTRQLLAFSRKQVLRLEPLDLNAAIRDAHAILARVIGEDVTLEVSLDPDVGTVMADRGQFDQVVMNLVVNARDAMPDGGRVTVTTANSELDETYAAGELGLRPGRYVCVSVADTGVGMSPETRSRLFEPFFTTKGPGKGTGLGLATVHGIVKQSQGHVAVYTELGSGTVFPVYLPRIDGSLLALPEDEPVAAARGGTETLLLVEDEAAVRGLAVEVLECEGYRVLAAKSGAEAIEVAKRTRDPIHLLLTDVVMPGMNGRQLAERLAPLHPEAAVIFASGYTDDVIAHHGVLDPGADLVEKPYTREVLLRRVRLSLDRHAERRAAEVARTA
jgi:PAS domain S-box-containing protein